MTYSKGAGARSIGANVDGESLNKFNPKISGLKLLSFSEEILINSLLGLGSQKMVDQWYPSLFHR